MDSPILTCLVACVACSFAGLARQLKASEPTTFKSVLAAMLGSGMLGGFVTAALVLKFGGTEVANLAIIGIVGTGVLAGVSAEAAWRYFRPAETKNGSSSYFTRPKPDSDV